MSTHKLQLQQKHGPDHRRDLHLNVEICAFVSVAVAVDVSVSA